MASKVIVKMPVTAFGQVTKSKSSSVNGDMAVTRSHDMAQTPKSPAKEPTSPKTQEQSRIAQLEQNLKFLQEQHQLMLAGLHNEIESLKVRNRELQFQLVFAKGSTPVSSPSSSSEDDLKHKVYSSPKPANLTPLQIELLERDVGELRIQLQETECRNAHLNSLIEDQKIKLERFEREKDKQCERLKSGGAERDDSDLERRLEDAESLIRRLRRENSDLRRDNAARFAIAKGGAGENGYGATSPRSSGGMFGGGNNSRGGNGGGRHKGNGHYRDDWFPPLNSQNYWHNGRRGGNNGSGGRGKRHSVPSPETVHLAPEEASNTLPELNQQQQQHHNHQQHPPQSGSHPQYQGRHGGRRSHHNNNHHYQEGGGGGGGGAGGGRKYHHRSNQQHKNPQT